MQLTERETYDVLEWLGDVGGLFDALYYLAYFFVTPLTTYKLRIELLSSVFRSSKLSEQNEVGSKWWQNNENMSSFRKRSIFYLVTHCRKTKNYRHLLKQSEEAIKGQLDLAKFLQRLKYQSLAVLALLSWRQKLAVSKMSPLVLNHQSS